MNQEEVADYREVQEEESYLIERPNEISEIVIVMKRVSTPCSLKPMIIILGTMNHNAEKRATPAPV
jgi:hypothetical protein